MKEKEKIIEEIEKLINEMAKAKIVIRTRYSVTSYYYFKIISMISRYNPVKNISIWSIEATRKEANFWGTLTSCISKETKDKIKMGLLSADVVGQTDPLHPVVIVLFSEQLHEGFPYPAVMEILWHEFWHVHHFHKTGKNVQKNIPKKISNDFIKEFDKFVGGLTELRKQDFKYLDEKAAKSIQGFF